MSSAEVAMTGERIGNVGGLDFMALTFQLTLITFVIKNSKGMCSPFVLYDQ